MSRANEILSKFKNENVKLNEDNAYNEKKKIEEKLKEFNLSTEQVNTLMRMITYDYVEAISNKIKTSVLKDIETLKHFVERISV